MARGERRRPLRAVFRWLGIDASPTPPSNARTRELGAKYTSGDECYPAKVTVGDFLRVIEQPGFDPERPRSSCPPPKVPAASASTRRSCARSCDEAGYGDVQVLSPTSKNGYADLGDMPTPFMRGGVARAGCGRHCCARRCS